MRLSKRQTDPVRPSLFTYLLIALLAVGLGCWPGCQRSDTPPAPDSQLSGGPARGTGAAPATSETESTASMDRTGAAPPQGSAQEVLDAMVNAYQEASTYQDQGYVEIGYQPGPTPMVERMQLRVALARPNKIRVEAFQRSQTPQGGVLVADGKNLWGIAFNMPDQVLKLDAPAELSIESLCPSHVLADRLALIPTRSFSWLPLQLILLLADDPLKTLLHGAEPPQLIEPGKIGEHDCDRVQIRRTDGTAVFWIDRQTHALRRFEFPTAALRMMIAQAERTAPEQIQGAALIAELAGAQFGEAIDPKAFEFQVRPEVKRVEEFVPSAIRWLGQSVPEFSFVDLEGNRITRGSLAGKIAVLDFWATWCDPCRMTLPELEQVYQKYKDNEQLVFLAVSVDEPSVTDQKLRDAFREMGINVPIARDPEDSSARAFQVFSYPTSMVLDGKAAVQDRMEGAPQPGVVAQRLSANLDALLAGVDLAGQARQQYEQSFEAQRKQFQGMLENCIKNDLYVFMRPETPRAELVERAEPKAFKLTELWSCTELAAPRSILVLEHADQRPRLLVLESGEAVAEIAPQGNVVSVKSLSLPQWEDPQGEMQQEPVHFLRTAVGGDGRRYFVGSSIGVQQVHVWDEAFNLLTSFPQDAFQNPHRGIADARIADFKGDGTLELAVSYLDVVGVHGVSLQGERVWANKSIVESIRLGVLGPDDTGQRSLLCINSANNSLAVLDPAGQVKGEFNVPNRALVWLKTADLDGDGQVEICALSMVGGRMEAIGLSLEGEQLWSYPLPIESHYGYVEAVTAGKLFTDQPGQWLLASADGRIHFLDAQGKLIDVYATGKTLAGVATAEWDGKQVLLVASSGVPGPETGPAGPGSVSAWQVEPLDNP